MNGIEPKPISSTTVRPSRAFEDLVRDQGDCFRDERQHVPQGGLCRQRAEAAQAHRRRGQAARHRVARDLDRRGLVQPGGRRGSPAPRRRRGSAARGAAIAGRRRAAGARHPRPAKARRRRTAPARAAGRSRPCGPARLVARKRRRGRSAAPISTTSRAPRCSRRCSRSCKPGSSRRPTTPLTRSAASAAAGGAALMPAVIGAVPRVEVCCNAPACVSLGWLRWIGGHARERRTRASIAFRPSILASSAGTPVATIVLR